MEQNKKPVVGITHGDINGISYEIILKSLKDPRFYENFTPVIYGSPKVAAYYKKVLKLSSINLNHINNINDAEEDSINIINCVTKIKVEIGKPTEMAGIASVNAIKHALIDIKHGHLDALVTAPINKHNIQASDFNFKGHTDFLKAEFNADDVLMFMIADDLKITVATEHIPTKDIAENITIDNLLSKIRLMNASLQKDFGISKPKIAVLGLNPHAGDLGLIGNEEKEIIEPAIEKAKEEGYLVLGPFPADGFFAAQTYLQFDAVLAMYHDQGLIPFKIIARDNGVNFTAGLPIVRTSPAHGTAYDIAGKNKANPKSFMEAVYWALKIAKFRKKHSQITPLQPQTTDNNKPQENGAVNEQ